MTDFAKGGIIPPGYTVAENRTGCPEVVLTPAQAEARLAKARAMLEDLDSRTAGPAVDDDLEDWTCGRCERGQCARCRDEDCSCCSGNPGDLHRLPGG